MAIGKTAFEQECRAEGFVRVAGLDEVGMGCLAGPVVAAAVILDHLNVPKGIDDSKKLSPTRREQLDQEIRRCAVSFGVGLASVEEIDEFNIYQAARLAMRRAVKELKVVPDFLLVDGRAKIECPIPQRSIIKGDLLSVSIGAASILAKVYRDALMGELDLRYPGYEFAKHKGYGSVLHRERLGARGASPIHRKSFSWTPV